MAQLPEGDPAPPSGELPNSVLNSASSSLHAYLHIPFCSVRCGYCDFNTYTASELRGVTQDSFIGDLLSEVELAKKVLDGVGLPRRELETVFFGGGTPTQLAASDLADLLYALRDNFGIAQGAEITTEANPDNVNETYLAELAQAGFTRVSLGMQSSVPAVLKTLDRTHNPANVATAVQAAKRVGLQVSVDLIYGTPGESMQDWQNSVETALSYEPSHISAYSLIVEPGTKMARKVASGELIESNDEEQAEKYELAERLFGDAGFNWYEVSNWSKSIETRSRHNLAYWQSRDWWGFGPGAHSHIGGVRWWNQKHPARYAAALSAGGSPALAREVLDENTRAVERVLLELRIKEGIEREVVEQAFPQASRSISELIADGLLDGKAAIQGRLMLTSRGRLLADAVVRKLTD